MSLLHQRSLPPEDYLDDLLRAYFKAEMPDPWPVLEAPAATRTLVPDRRVSRKPGRALMRSRLALAASIALLVSGPLFLASKMREPSTPNIVWPDNSRDTAERPKLDGPRRTTEGLIQKSDGTYIQIDIFELPATK